MRSTARIVFFISSSLASPASLCSQACQSAIATVQFVDTNSTLPAVSQCDSRLHLTSVYLCTLVHCSSADRVEWLDNLNQTCKDAHGLIPPFEGFTNYTDGAIAKLTRVNESYDLVATDAVLPEPGFYQRWFDTLASWEYVYGNHIAYGWWMGLFWGFVVVVGALQRLIPSSNISNEGPSNWLKRTITTPSTFPRGWYWLGDDSVTPRIQSITILLFVLINIYCTVHGYWFSQGNQYFPTITKQLLRFASDRTGIISYANFPMIWLFGMRNNLVMWLTGWDFGSCSNFHRWVAIVASVQAVLHSIGYTVSILLDGGWTYFAYWLGQMFFWAGELATIFMCAILAFSLHWVRRSHYEFFLITHIAFSLVVLVTMLGHISIFAAGYSLLVWIPALIWTIDRVLRAGRIVLFSRRWCVAAEAQYDESSNIIRLEVPISECVYTIRPGTFYYLTVVDDTKFWESHPFTVATADSVTSQSGEASPLLDREVGRSTPMMTFLIRPYDSFTKRLRDRAAICWPKTAAVKLLVEGPYGHSQPLAHSGRVVFIVAGSGMVVPLSYAKQLTSTYGSIGVHIHWGVREAAFAKDILGRDLAPVLESRVLELDIYLSGRDVDSQRLRSTEDVRLHSGRMEAAEILRAMGRKYPRDSIAIVSCGPASLAEDARYAALLLMKDHKARVEYFEESFTW